MSPSTQPLQTNIASQQSSRQREAVASARTTYSMRILDSRGSPDLVGLHNGPVFYGLFNIKNVVS